MPPGKITIRPLLVVFSPKSGCPDCVCDAKSFVWTWKAMEMKTLFSRLGGGPQSSSLRERPASERITTATSTPSSASDGGRSSYSIPSSSFMKLRLYSIRSNPKYSSNSRVKTGKDVVSRISERLR